jgi:hypothetical protein
MTAQPLASDIDTSTVAGHNLRALLLRLLDGDRWRDPSLPLVPVSIAAERLGLLDIDHAFALTPLGREVAERLRPVPWLVAQDVWLVEPSGVNGSLAPWAAVERDAAAELTGDLLGPLALARRASPLSGVGHHPVNRGVAEDAIEHRANPVECGCDRVEAMTDDERPTAFRRAYEYGPHEVRAAT